MIHQRSQPLYLKGLLMISRFRKPACVLLAFLIASNFAMPGIALAGTFNRTRVMDLKYAWGTCSMEEFDMWDQLYPGYLPIAEVTFEPDGTFTVFDTASGANGSGVYNKQGPNLEITILNPQSTGLVQYVGRKVAPRTFEGTIYIDGNHMGNWRGTF